MNLCDTCIKKLTCYGGENITECKVFIMERIKVDYQNAPPDDPFWDIEDAKSIINDLHLFLLAREQGRKELEATSLENGFEKYQGLLDRVCVVRHV